MGISILMLDSSLAEDLLPLVIGIRIARHDDINRHLGAVP